MFDSIQILLIIVITILTGLLTIIGIVIFQILKEVKFGLKKMNKMLDDVGLITESVANPVAEFSDFVMGLKKGAHFFKNISKFFKEDNFSNQKSKSKQTSIKLQKSKRKFFIKSGKKL